MINPLHLKPALENPLSLVFPFLGPSFFILNGVGFLLFHLPRRYGGIDVFMHAICCMSSHRYEYNFSLNKLF